jgi:hypothetical protein
MPGIPHRKQIMESMDLVLPDAHCLFRDVASQIRRGAGVLLARLLRLLALSHATGPSLVLFRGADWAENA